MEEKLDKFKNTQSFDWVFFDFWENYSIIYLTKFFDMNFITK